MRRNETKCNESLITWTSDEPGGGERRVKGFSHLIHLLVTPEHLHRGLLLSYRYILLFVKENTVTKMKIIIKQRQYGEREEGRVKIRRNSEKNNGYIQKTLCLTLIQKADPQLL